MPANFPSRLQNHACIHCYIILYYLKRDETTQLYESQFWRTMHKMYVVRHAHCIQFNENLLKAIEVLD